MDDREKILKSLAEAPRDAGQLSSLLGISRNALFSTLAKMEKEELIFVCIRDFFASQSATIARAATSGGYGGNVVSRVSSTGPPTVKW